MEKPHISKDNRILIERTQANKDISRGIEEQVNQLLVLNSGKRAREFLFFGCMYAVGALFTFFSNGILLSYFDRDSIYGCCSQLIGDFHS